jgi:hypothetical protein
MKERWIDPEVTYARKFAWNTYRLDDVDLVQVLSAFCQSRLPGFQHINNFSKSTMQFLQSVLPAPSRSVHPLYDLRYMT